MKEVSDRERSLPKAVIGKLLKIASESKEVISLSVGEPDFDAPYPLIVEGRKVLSKYKKNRVSHYTASQGIPQLREAIVQKLKKDNKIRTKPENILVTSGSQEALFAGFAAALDPKDEVVVPNPGYLAYIPAIKLLNGKPVFVRLEEKEKFEINPDALKKKITKKTRVLMLNTPSNPTGTVIRKKVLEEVADIAVDKDVYIFADEAYEQLVYGDVKHVSIASLNGMQDYVATYQTFSKSYAMCGFRLGYVAGPQELIEAMTKSIHYITLCPPHLSQHVGIKALTMSKKYVATMRTEYDRRRKYIVKNLNTLGLPTVMPQGAFYAFSNCKAYSRNSFSFAEEILKKAKIAVVPGTEFGSGGQGYLRFSYATKMKNIEIAMHRLEKFLSKKKKS